MSESVYKVIQLVGTSSESWEKAAAAAIAGGFRNRPGPSRGRGRRPRRGRRDDGAVSAYRAKLNVSFKYEDA